MSILAKTTVVFGKGDGSSTPSGIETVFFYDL